MNKKKNAIVQAGIRMLVPVSVHPGGELVFSGSTTERALQNMFERSSASEHDWEGFPFRIEGDPNIYRYLSVAMHYCFAKGRISVDEALEMMHRY